MSTTCIGKLWAVTSFLASLATAVGYYFPYWLEGYYMHENGVTYPMYFGIFRRCSYPKRDKDGTVAILDECGRYSDFLDIPSIFWQIGTVTIGTGACLSLLVSMTALVSLCVRDIITARLARFTGVMQLCAGLLVGGGLAIYPYGWDTVQVKQACGGTSGVFQLGGCHLYWAFYLTAGGGALTMICSTLACHAFKYKLHTRISYDL
ncbi:unnamed protein product [Lymnaea stagnalis]|uniref:Lipoma HMGIC fusion partner-like protein n=1 Tax=Lymnaea stagnalis TaxID=6523 RepID=A0AAV2IAM2_LYMST